MKYILIILALSFVACKNCTTCEVVITNEDGVYLESTYSQETTGDCSLSKSEYEEKVSKELEVYIEYYDATPILGYDSSYATTRTYKTHYYTLDCN